MAPEVIAAGIMAGSSLLGGGLSGSTSKKESRHNRHEARRQFNEQMDFAKNQTQYRVQDALKAGINPLAVLGQSANVSPTFSAGYPSGAGDAIGNGIARAGDAIGKGILDKADRKKAEKAALDKAFDDAAYDSQSKELSLEEQRLKNRILRQQLRGVTDRPGVDVQPSMMGEGTIFKPVYDLHGRPRLVVNQDVLEGDSDNAGYSATLVSALADGQISKTTGRVLSPQLRMMLDDYYYQTTGHHIKNLEELYVSPTELVLATANAADQSGFHPIKWIRRKFGGK